MAQFYPKGSITLERSLRSVFIGNISYDVTDDQIKQVFSKVGPAVHLRLVHDRDTGRPKGFGFCEYPDVQTAEAAIRNFNGYELNGRPLRVDSAASSDRNVEEAQHIQAAAQAAKEPARPADESPYGKEPEPGKAPEAIAKVVAAMPPEQMFELMKQIKQNVISNPAQTRRMLMEQPQLAYALLQAQVVMRVVDPKVAYSMLHREAPATQQPFHLQQPPPVSTANGYNRMQVPFNLATPIHQPPPPVAQYRPQGPPPPHSFQAGPPQSFDPRPRFGGPMSVPPPSHVPPAVSHANVPSIPQLPNQGDDEKTQAEMLLKVIKLTDEQINLLPAEDRAKVLELRNQLRQRIVPNQPQ